MLPPFSVFLEQQRDAVYRLLLASVGREEVDDCFQETFLAALRAYPRLRPDSNLRAWVLRIAERKALDAHRARNARPRPQGEVADDEPAPAQTDHDPALWAAVRRLPPKQRSAVVGRFVTDLSYADVAAAMGTTEEAARQNVRAALIKLRKEWSHVASGA
jgi:RNA polymerase sigma factor (sigma-70 family)